MSSCCFAPSGIEMLQHNSPQFYDFIKLDTWDWSLIEGLSLWSFLQVLWLSRSVTSTRYKEGKSMIGCPISMDIQYLHSVAAAPCDLLVLTTVFSLWSSQNRDVASRILLSSTLSSEHNNMHVLPNSAPQRRHARTIMEATSAIIITVHAHSGD